jgi:hypothetical protein
LLEDVDVLLGDDLVARVDRAVVLVRSSMKLRMLTKKTRVRFIVDRLLDEVLAERLCLGATLISVIIAFGPCVPLPAKSRPPRLAPRPRSCLQARRVEAMQEPHAPALVVVATS